MLKEKLARLLCALERDGLKLALVLAETIKPAAERGELFVATVLPAIDCALLNLFPLLRLLRNLQIRRQQLMRSRGQRMIVNLINKFVRWQRWLVFFIRRRVENARGQRDQRLQGHIVIACSDLDQMSIDLPGVANQAGTAISSDCVESEGSLQLVAARCCRIVQRLLGKLTGLIEFPLAQRNFRRQNEVGRRRLATAFSEEEVCRFFSRCDVVSL